MQIRGVIRSADLQEYPPGSDRIEIVIGVQGVGAGQPRRLVIPFEYLLKNEGIDPEDLAGRGFLAEVIEEENLRWVISEIALASKVLRPGT